MLAAVFVVCLVTPSTHNEYLRELLRKAEEIWLSFYFDLMEWAHVCKEEDHGFEGVIGLRKIHRDFGLLKTVFGRDPGPLTSDNRSHP